MVNNKSGKPPAQNMQRRKAKTNNNNNSNGKRVAQYTNVRSARQFNAPPGTLATPIFAGGPIYSSTPTGDINIKYEEEWSHVGFNNLGNAHFSDTVSPFLTFQPGVSGASRLDALGRLWELYRVNKVCVTYRTSSGTTTNGSLTFGVDYEGLDFVSTAVDVAILVPRMNLPVWASGSMSPSIDRVMKKKWLACHTDFNTMVDAGFLVSIAGQGAPNTVAGTFWVSYDVTFTSPTAPPSMPLIESTQTLGVDGAGAPTLAANSGLQVYSKGPGDRINLISSGTNNITLPDVTQIQWRPNVSLSPGVYRLITHLQATATDSMISLVNWANAALVHTVDAAGARILDHVKETFIGAAFGNTMSTTFSIPSTSEPTFHVINIVGYNGVVGGLLGTVRWVLQQVGPYTTRQIDAS